MKDLTSKITRLLVLSALVAMGVFGNTTTLDTSFNGTGYRLQTVGTEHAGSSSLAIQPDGKIIVGGNTRTASENNQFALTRLNADGTLDTSFGTGATAFAPLSIRPASPARVSIQPDGKILLGSSAWMVQQQTYSFVIFRFTSNGALDTTFNNVGYTTANIPNSFWDICVEMGVGTDGKIVLVGQALTTPGQAMDWDIAVMRFNVNGSLDTTFDGDGMIKLGTEPADEEAHSVLVQSDNKIVIGGRASSDRDRFMLMRLNANGSTDTSFGTNGWNIFQVDFVNNNFTSLARLSDGKLLAGGGGKIMRFTADGARDMSFAGTGVQYDTGTIEEVDISVISGDKFLVATRYGVRRFMSNGGADTHYWANFNVSGNFCFMNAVAVQSDGKAVLGGYCSNDSNNLSRIAVARFQENRTKRFVDFNGDERTDMSIYRPSNGQWWYLESSNLFYQIVAGQFGTPTDQPIPADFSGDGKADLAVFRPSTGQWYVLRSDDGTYYSFPFGQSGDTPIVGDFDNDQLADAGIFRPSTNQWFIQRSIGDVVITTFGASGDKPVASDYDGDFKTDIAIYRPSNGQWWIQRSSDGSHYVLQFGTSTDKPVPGDYTGDNKTDTAFYRPQSGEWFVLRSENFSYFSIPFGLSDDLPTPGNFAGDTRFDFVVFRPSTNRWHMLPTGGSYLYRDFGSAGDIPLSTVVMP